MPKIGKLVSHLPYFESVEGRGTASMVKEANLFYVDYEEGLRSFVADFHDSGIADTSYTETLANAGIRSSDEMASAIPAADEAVLRAMLTQMVREERFSSGALARYANDGVIAEVLRRLSE
ncbi:hypothetical protein NCCP2716_29800 [Sporosarcina sp. NCCP-2716]|uniref:DUF6508 domain-containing protein n=1 Tax=Sporosarcina sp. NCCP-2716 TaxID=2943679 RepID=UPI002041F1EF|nr:DUF6508 domain-containing protein [Sporosarcina sp. NCCP-2716]GKV70482.1 hypothetical protein NCCP2716_29800 [Sporosarcina sp. NCCP-2716]